MRTRAHIEAHMTKKKYSQEKNICVRQLATRRMRDTHSTSSFKTSNVSFVRLSNQNVPKMSNLQTSPLIEQNPAMFLYMIGGDVTGRYVWEGKRSCVNVSRQQMCRPARLSGDFRIVARRSGPGARTCMRLCTGRVNSARE